MKWRKLRWLLLGIFTYLIITQTKNIRTSRLEISNLVEDEAELSSSEVLNCLDDEWFEPAYPISEEDRKKIEQIVACEAGADTIEGQRAIALCIRNYCDLRSCTVDDAIRDMKITTYKREVTEENRSAVSDIWDFDIDVPTEECIIVWCTPKAAANGAWHETQRFVAQFGAHRFYALNE